MSIHDEYEQLRLAETPVVKHRKQKRKMPNISPIVLAICVAASSLFGFAGGAAANYLQPRAESVIYTAADTDTYDPYHISNLSAVTGATENTVEKTSAAIKQSVVEISTETAVTNPWMRQFVTGGAGSGVIISADGYIITNNHVIDGARSITVIINSKKYPATIVGADPQTDLALLKIDSNNLTPAVLGDSGKLVVGELAIAVGNPLGELGGTVTSGIISALDRVITIDGQDMSLLQTDASINPGNSGGGLFNLNGQLIGIVNAKSSGSNIEGIGFAIPINTAKPVIDNLMQYGYVRGRVDTGLTLVDIQSVQTAMRYRISQFGLYILDSAHPELKNGDRITAVGGKEITDGASFNAAIKAYKVGDKINISVDRYGEPVTVSITLSEQKS